jgi:hypothetical protein
MLTYITGATMSVFHFVKSWRWCRGYGFIMNNLLNHGGGVEVMVL